MKIVIPFSAIKKIYISSPQDGEIMGIIHSNDSINYDKVLISHKDDHKGNECRLDDIVVGTVSFHTHPKICYDIYNTNIGWPSLDDLMALSNEDNMKVLIVPALEGVYVIAKKKKISSDLINKIKHTYKNYISKDKNSIKEYIDVINSVCKGCVLLIFFSKDTISRESPNKKIHLEVFED